MFIDVLKEIEKLDNGKELEVMEVAVVVNINNKLTPVPVRFLENIELDNDEIEKAENFYFDYQGENYMIPMPEKDSTDWYQVLEIIEPE